MNPYNPLLTEIDAVIQDSSASSADLRQLLISSKYALKESKENYEFLKRNIYWGLIGGHMDNCELNASLLQEYDISVFDNQFILIAFRHNGPELTKSAYDKDAQSEAEIHSKLVPVSEYAQRLLSEIGLAYTVVYYDDLICILRDTQISNPALQIAIKKIVEFGKQHYRLSLISAASDPMFGLGSISASYTATTKLLDYGMIQNSREVVRLCHDMRHPMENFETDRYSSVQYKLFQYIKNAQFDLARQILLEIIAGASDLEISCLQQYKCRLFGLTDIMLVASDSWSNAVQANNLRGAEYDIIFNFKNISQLSSSLLSYLDFMQSVYDSFNDDTGTVGKMRLFINKHLTDYDLSVNGIANYYSLSVPQATQLFRERYNMSILDYIHISRLEIAKHKLRSSTETVSAISAAVGYGSSLTLNRAFKRYEGITPTEYRERFHGIDFKY